MSAIHPILQALGLALLHFVWQGALVALLLLAIRLRVRASSTRYLAACGAMLFMLAAFAATVAIELPRAPTPVIENQLTAGLPLHPVPAGAAALAASAILTSKPTPTAPPDWIAALWLLGVASMSIYTLTGWARAQRLKQEVLETLEIDIEKLARNLGVTRAVRVCSSALAQVPAVIGWLRPVILLPVTALTGLTDSQLEAILAHELAHIRRHDYLVNLFQTAIETLLFYHPAVWWVSREIRNEREHCCDDIAVSVCGDPISYASALAEMEEIRGRFPEPALAATGGDLLTRIRRLLGEPDNSSGNVGRTAAIALALFIAGVPALLSQEAKPAFEVASVKPNITGDANYYFRMGGASPSITNQTLRNMIKWAYRVQDFQIVAGPNWINSDRYDVQARTSANASMEQRNLMVQTLLQDRFKLAVHREVREVPIFELRVVKSGLKIQPIKPGDCIAHDPLKPEGPPAGKTVMDMCGSSGFGRGSLLTSSATMDELAQMLSNAVQRTVVDKTGMSGQFRITLKFAPEDTNTAQNGGPPPPSDAPSIYTALQEQLGLKLDSAKGPVEVLVIDHAEKPSDN